jgi:hypothetical protein
VTAPTPHVSPDGYWRWDGHAWVPNYAYPTPHWGPPPAAQKSSNTKVILAIVGGVIAVGLVFFVVLPMLVFFGLSRTIDPEEIFDAPADSAVTMQLDSAGAAEEAYRHEHGVYTGSVTGHEEYGFEARDGIDVKVAWVKGTDYCLVGSDATTTYYLGTGYQTPEPGTVSSVPCDFG